MTEEYENNIFELRSIKRTLNIAYSDKIDSYLERTITTKKRRIMWQAIDGVKMPNEIAEEAKVTPMAVSLFLKYLSELSLVQYVQGNPPRRIIDHVPVEWINDVIE